jgi:hypothetical protein
MMAFAVTLQNYLVRGQWKWSHPDNPLPNETVRYSEQARYMLTKECSEKDMEKTWWMAMFNPVARIVPFLPPQLLTKLVRTIETSPCANNFSNSHRDLLSLLMAVGRRDPALMANSAEKLLPVMEKNIIDADLFEYILSAGMLGNISLGNLQEAHRLWGKYGGLLPSRNAESMTIRLLVAHLSREQIKK